MIGRRELLRFLGFGSASMAVPVALTSAAQSAPYRPPMWVEMEPGDPPRCLLKVLCSDGKTRTLIRWQVQDGAPGDGELDNFVPIDIHYTEPKQFEVNVP